MKKGMSAEKTPWVRNDVAEDVKVRRNKANNSILVTSASGIV